MEHLEAEVGTGDAFPLASPDPFCVPHQGFYPPYGGKWGSIGCVGREEGGWADNKSPENHFLPPTSPSRHHASSPKGPITSGQSWSSFSGSGGGGRRAP